MKKVGVNLRHARNKKQLAIMKCISRDKVCPFCHDFCGNNPLKYHTKPILKKTTWWTITENFAPLDGTKIHILLVYRGGHVTVPKEIPAKAWVDLGQCITWVVKKFKLPAGGFFFRFGNTDYTGASVKHFHCQIVFGGKKDGVRLRVKLGYKNK